MIRHSQNPNIIEFWRNSQYVQKLMYPFPSLHDLQFYLLLLHKTVTQLIKKFSKKT